MGNSKSKKQQKEPDRFFEREKWRKNREKSEKKKINVKDSKRRGVVVEPTAAEQPLPAPRPAPSLQRSYDEEAVERMKYQLNNDSDAFLLNNILLSIQFFENYEREIGYLKSNPVSEWDNDINNEMVNHNKHVFVADKLHELIHENVQITTKNAEGTEPLGTQRMFVIYDNIEASEPGDNSDYSYCVLDAPVYKMLIENCSESGYVKLKKVEVLEGAQAENKKTEQEIEGDNKSDFADSEKESTDDEYDDEPIRGEELLLKLKMKLEEQQSNDRSIETFVKINSEMTSSSTSNVRRPSGPLKNRKIMFSKEASLAKSRTVEENVEGKSSQSLTEMDNKFKRAAPKANNRRLSGPIKQIEKINSIKTNKLSQPLLEEGETSGYGTNTSPQNESSGTESDYGYATITAVTTPKKLQRTSLKDSNSTGVVPDNCWIGMKTKSDVWSDGHDDDEEEENSKSGSEFLQLYSTQFYLNCNEFMAMFVDHFITKLGKSIGLSTDSIENALTQGASIYCETIKKNVHINLEVIPAIIIPWPSTAYEWIIRERRIIQNPKTNFSYQWPTKYMVNKARGLGAILVPVGFRPKRGGNSEENVQWKIVFPAVESYLDTCLAHSQVRCYMFTLALLRTYLQIEPSKIGLDTSSIKNHLFWECEDNYARWPEDRLGETLRLFLRSLYKHFSQSRFPDYFIEDHNIFKNIPKNLLLKLQRRLADILESPVMHTLNAVHKLKYTKKNYYPPLDCLRLYNILVSKNVLRLLNPNLPNANDDDDSGNESENEYREGDISFWDKAKYKDKTYQFRKEQHRQAQAKRRIAAKKKKESSSQKQEIDHKIVLPLKMDSERRRLVLEFFIPHFIAMAIQSEKFEALKQAIIYLEHAQRLTTVLSGEPGGEIFSQEYALTIKVKLNEFKIKLADIKYKLPQKRLSVKIHNYQRTTYMNQSKPMMRRDYANLHAIDSPPLPVSSAEKSFAFVDVHTVSETRENQVNKITLHEEIGESDEESRL